MPSLMKTLLIILFCSSMFSSPGASAKDRPNILIAISDDQSYPHASAYGEPVIQTPGFDRVAKQGMLFHNAFTPAPGCSPMRAAFLTGKYIWEIGAAGTHASHFPKELRTYPNELRKSGYHIGYTGKPWGPGNLKPTGRTENPAGPAYNQINMDSPAGIASTDYASNFEVFLDEKGDDEPFCFWFGGKEPHRVFKPGIGAEAGMDATAVRVPEFLPDSPEVRDDLLDYFFEIQWFDSHLVRMLNTLEERGLLDNTMVVVTSDNGMSFPRAKANAYEYGIHMPLAISLPTRFRGSRQSRALVNLIDVTATIYEIAEIEDRPPLSGKSLVDVLEGHEDHDRSATYSGRERHSSSRYNSLGYPQRCVRTQDYLFIRNYTPERWPAGTPQKYATANYDSSGALVSKQLGPEHGGYHDIDACPTLDFMIANHSEPTIGRLFELSVGKRPAEEFYAIQTDSACMQNLIESPELQETITQHREMLSTELTRTGDLREIDFQASHVWETYPRYSPLRWFPVPEWTQTKTLPTQEWLEQRRPRK